MPHTPSSPGPTAAAAHARFTADSQPTVAEPARRPAPDRGRTLLGPALTLIHTGRTPTRSALTAELDVTRATAGAVAAELAALGLVTVDPHPIGTGRGRPSHRLGITPDGPLVLAAQLHADGLSVALAGLGGVLGEPVHHPLPADTGPEQVLRAIAEAGAALIRGTRRRCLGAALALPHPVTEPDGTALAALHFGWPSGTPVGALFAELLAEQLAAADLGPRVRHPLPTAVANDANLAALAEYRHGAGRDARHLLLVTAGHRGVGGALVVDGRLHTGSAGLALEVGHLTVDRCGRDCPCGNRGCLNVETDPQALLAAADRTPAPGVPLLAQAQAVIRAADHDPRAREAVDQVAKLLAIGLAGLANILNPDRIVLSGLHRELLAAAPDRLRAIVADRSLWGRVCQVRIVAAELEHAELVGAAELAWQPYLADPQLAAR